MALQKKALVDNSDEFMLSVGMQPFEHPEIDKYIDEGEEIYLGNTKIEVIHLPGHTQGGVGYLVNGMLFSGDTIFLESIGRTDLIGGNHSQLVQTIKDKIFTLDGDTIIYVGHGTNTTVEHEKKYNEFV
ncbi:MAG: MBL fold metallo-hydrolase [Candidatus Gastranaerophilaceae bacterium]